jgi:hypothetical protein
MSRECHAIACGFLLAFGMTAPAAAAPAPGLTALVATTARPALRPGAVPAGGLAWRCAGSRCTTPPVRPQDLPAQCRALAREVGAMSSFAQGVSRLTAKQLATCNESAAISPTSPPSPGLAALVATTVRPALRLGAVPAGGLSWRCAGSRCNTPPVRAQNLLAQCRALAREVGAISSFAQGTSRLPAKELATCNESAAIGPLPTPGLAALLAMTVRPALQIGNVAAGGLSWECAASRCTTVPLAPQDLPVRCRALAQEVGAISTLAQGARHLTSKQLTLCNRSPRPTPPEPPGPTPDPNARITVDPDGAVRVRTTRRLTMTGLGDRTIAPPAPEPPVMVRPRESLTMDGLGDRVIVPPAPEPPVFVRVPSILTMTGTHGPPLPTDTVTVRVRDVLTMTGLGDRTIAPPAPEPPVMVRPRESLTMNG